MHSSRIRTVRCSGRRGGMSAWGVCAGGWVSARGISAQGGVYPSMHWVGRLSAPVHAGIHPPPVDRILDTHL